MATLNEIAAHFRKYGHRRRRDEVAHYGAPGKLSAVVSRSVRSIDHWGRRDSHQRRIPTRVLERAEKELLSALPIVRKARNFDELHRAVGAIVGPIHGVGALLVYDVAQRICLATRLPEPPVVYLHAGTARGARTIGIRGKTVEIAALPKVLRRFTSFELEDLFCNYAKYLAGAPLPDGPL